MKICLVRNDKMGDMILTLPVAQGLKEENQDYKIDIVCSKKNQKICKNYMKKTTSFLNDLSKNQVLDISRFKIYQEKYARFDGDNRF